MSIKHRNQAGAAMVEFAIVAWVFFLLLFGVIEFARLLFTFNTLTEVARRGARVAAVCPPNDPKIKTAALFVNLPNLTTANIQVRYLASIPPIIPGNPPTGDLGDSCDPTGSRRRYL